MKSSPRSRGPQPPPSLLFYTRGFDRCDGRDQLLFFGLLHLELFEGSEEMACRDVEILIANAQAFMSSSHVAARVRAGTTRRQANELNDVLAQAHFRVVGHSTEKLREFGLRDEPAQEIICNGRHGIVAADPLVEGWPG